MHYDLQTKLTKEQKKCFKKGYDCHICKNSPLTCAPLDDETNQVSLCRLKKDIIESVFAKREKSNHYYSSKLDNKKWINAPDIFLDWLNNKLPDREEEEKRRNLDSKFFTIIIPRVEISIPNESMEFEIYSRNRWESMDIEELYNLNEDVALLEKTEAEAQLEAAEAWELAVKAQDDANEAWELAVKAQIQLQNSSENDVESKRRNEEFITHRTSQKTLHSRRVRSNRKVQVPETAKAAQVKAKAAQVKEADAWEKAEAAQAEAKAAQVKAKAAQDEAVTAAAAVDNKTFRKERVITLAKLLTDTTPEVTKDMKKLSKLLIKKDMVENELYGMSDGLREIYNKCNESTQTSFLPPLNEDTPIDLPNNSASKPITNQMFDNSQAVSDNSHLVYDIIRDNYPRRDGLILQISN